jgi:hypothetical protein
MTDKTIRRSGAISMLMTSERRPAIRTMRGWAIDVLQNAGAIRECEEHGWMQDRADPHAWERAIDIAREDPPAGVSPDAAAAEVRDVLNSIGDTCPECPPDSGQLFHLFWGRHAPARGFQPTFAPAPRF